MTSNDRVAELLAPLVEKRGLDLEAVLINPAGRRSVVQVLIDRDGGVDLDLVAAVSREISDALDATDLLGNNPYTLDVGSVGIDRPLSLSRHFRRNKNRLVEIETTAGEVFIDRILESNENSVTFKETAKILDISEIKKAQVQVEFNRVD
ncbi:MAG: ribosome maturation factor RimP [Candidatus Nanopelagicales bacterium]